MRILIVSNGFPPRGQWGTEYYAHQLVQGLRVQGHELAVLHPDRSGAKPRYTLEHTTAGDVPIFLLHNPGDPGKDFLDSYSNPRVEELFGEVLDEWRPDLVHFVYLLWGLSVGMPTVARSRGVPSVVTLTDYGLLCHRGQMYDWKLRRCGGPHAPQVCARCIREPSIYDHTRAQVLMRRWAVRTLAVLGGLGQVVTTRDLALRESKVRAALQDVDHFIAPTEIMAQTFERFGVPRERMTRLVYAIDDRSFAVARADPPPIGPPGNHLIRFGFLGQFTPHKGLGTLLRAVEIMERRLPESVEPWEVRLFGGPSGGRHKRFAQAALEGYRGRRVVVGEPFAPYEAPLVLADLHAVVLPSEWDENAPLTVLQARAAGVPVIASDVAGVAEIVEPGVHGQLFPPGDADALADLMREVVLGRVPRGTSCEPPLTLQAHVRRVEQLYAQVGGGPA